MSDIPVGAGLVEHAAIQPARRRLPPGIGLSAGLGVSLVLWAGLVRLATLLLA